MRPTPIPDGEIWAGAERSVYAAPDGNLLSDRCAPVEALVDRSGDGLPRASVRLTLEPGDLERLAAGGVVWLTFYGAMVPWSVDVKAPGE